MKTVEVSESALESLKAMVERLQFERDKLLFCSELLMIHADNGAPAEVKAHVEKWIAKCTQTQ